MDRTRTQTSAVVTCIIAERRRIEEAYREESMRRRNEQLMQRHCGAQSRQVEEALAPSCCG
jgi:hypothetical protein